MPLPTRTVAATFTGRAGATVLFRLLNTVSDGTDIAEAGTQTLATLDGSGVLSQALLCQDPSLDADPVYDWRPIFGFAEWVRGIVVPAGTGSVALASLSPSGTPLTPTQFTQLDEAVTAEATARAAGDTANASNLTAETTRATTAEAGKAATVHTHGEADVTGLSTDLAAKVPTTRLVAGHALSADVTLVKGDVGLGNVDNTADTAKPVSTAQAAADTAVQTAAASDATAKVATETTRATAAEALKAPLASPALTGTPTVNGATVEDRTHASGAYAPVVEPLNTVGTAGAAQTIPNPAVGGNPTISRLTLTANCTLTFPTATAGASFTLVLVQNGTGSWTVTWPGTVKWAAGTAPTLSTGAGKIDYLSFVCTDGTNWAGFVSGLDMR